MQHMIQTPHGMLVDARGPTSWNATPEGRKLRARIRAQIEAGLRKRHDSPLARHDTDHWTKYAEALGITRDAALAREQEQINRLAAFTPDATPEAPQRRLTDATGPTDWCRDAIGKRLRASILSAIDRRLYEGAPSSAHLWSNAPMSAGNKPSRYAPEW